ncbi:MAG: MbcA/ParS/Xre antitoxin family protein [Polyangiales bacterium]
MLTKAVLRAADMIGLLQSELASILGVSDATVSRFKSGGSKLDPTHKDGEIALLFLRVFRSLDTLLGGNKESLRAWMRADNAHLVGKPVDRVRTIEGLVHVAEYLDAMRGKL